MMEPNFVLGEDIDQADRLAPILTELGLSAESIVDQAQAEPAKKRLREQTEHVNIWRPTFFAGTEMFWGNDRLNA